MKKMKTKRVNGKRWKSCHRTLKKEKEKKKKKKKEKKKKEKKKNRVLPEGVLGFIQHDHLPDGIFR